MADNGADRDASAAAQGASRGVPPGALSALLRELADVPAEPRAAALPQPGAVIGRFELVRRIGGGGFGVVYEARDRTLGRSVAFKLVRPGRFAAGEEILGREAEVIAQLSHPNLVTLFDVGRAEQGPFLVLELLRGETLHERIRRGRLDVAEALRVAVEISKGLAHAHAHGVVHRDLKPSNVFLCQDGQVKLLDFGMSRAFGRGRVSGGTPSYMAPEQWRGAPEDERTDVYALGVMLFELLAGELPFPEPEGKGPPPRRRAPALEVAQAPALGDLVARMLEHEATGRPRDGAEVLAALSALAAELARAGAPAGGLPPRVRRRWRRLPLVLGAALAALLAAGGAAEWTRRTRPPPPPRAIVVLPFVNLSDSPDNEYFSDGLTEEVLHLLTRLRELRVAARSSTFYFKHKKVQVSELAQRLGVDVVLEGSVRRDRDRLRVSAELIDARSGFNLWAQTYDRALADVFAIQEDIARQVVGGLELVLSRASEGELRKPRAASLAAYDLYLRGRAQLRLPPTAETLDRATAAFEQAAAADAAFAPAHAGLCEAWLSRYELTRATDAFAHADAACTRALAREPDAGEVYLALGTLHLLSGRYDTAEQQFQRAAALPNHAADALLGLARAQLSRGRFGEAEAAFDRAIQADPGYWRAHRARGTFMYQRGRYAEAVRSYTEEIARTPDDAGAHNNLGAAYYALGDVEKAIAAWRTSIELAPRASALSNLGASEFLLGHFEEAVASYRRAIQLAPGDHRPFANLADALARLPGREAEARAACEKAIALGQERLRVNPADASATAALARCNASLGRAELARRLRDRALEQDPSSRDAQYSAAIVSVRVGDTEAALAATERAVALGYNPRLLQLDPELERLRSQPRFQAVVRPPPK